MNKEYSDYLKFIDKESLKYIQRTVNSAEDFHITWDFDEQQADPFHQFWDGRVFIKHLILLLKKLKIGYLY